MAYASRAGRARTSASNPSAHAICDRCGFRYNRIDLHWNFDWRGPVLANTRLLVCDRCLDTPQEQQRAIVLPADPTPIIQPRPEFFSQYESDFRVTAAPPVIDPTTGIPIPQGIQLVTEAGANRIANPVGSPDGIPLAAVQTNWQKQPYGPTLSVITAIGDGNNKVTVNCTTPHGLSVGSQIVASGLTSKTANGPFGVDIVVSATSFAYYTQDGVPSGVLWQSGSAIWTAHIGVPYGVQGYPQTGGSK